MIKAAGVLLTPDYNLIQTYFFGNNTILPSISLEGFKEIADKQKDTLLFTTDRSRNLISLQHTLGEETKQIITLEIIDPDENFEQRFVSFTLATQFLNNIQEKDKQLNIFKSKLRLIPNNPDEDKGVRDRLLLEDQKFIGFINQNLARLRTEKKLFYLAYGIGSDFQDWAGPFACEFTEAKVKYSSEGQRRITLYFVPSNSPAGAVLGMDGDKIPLTLYTGNYTAQVTVPIANIEKTKVFNFPSPLEYKFSKLIYGLYEKYLNVIYANKANVIILLPDINKLCSKLILSYAGKHVIEHNKARPTSFRYQAFAFSIISDMLSDFGCMVTTEYRTSDNPIKFRNLIGGTAEQRAEFYSKKAAAPNKIEDTQDKLFAATIAVNIQDPYVDFFKPIETLTNTLGQYGRTIVLFEENNTRILDIWKRYGLILDSSKPTVVLADKDLAFQFLYGAYEKSTVAPESVVLEAKPRSGIEILSGKPPENDYLKFKYDTEAAIDTANKKDATYYLSEEDQKEFINLGMTKELKEITKSGFRYIYGELEDSGYAGIDLRLDNVRNLIRKTKETIPIFRFNVKNPNVEKIELDSKSSYTVVLQAAVHRQITDFATRFVKKDAALDQLDQRFRSVYKHINEIKSVFFERATIGDYDEIQKIALKYIQTDNNLKFADPTELSKFMALAIIHLSETNSGEVSPIIQLDTNTDSELVNLCKIYFDLISKSYAIKLRTLPFFKLSTYYDVALRKVFLIAATLNAYGTKPSKIDKILTNMYNMVSFTHVITETDAYSEFTLVINPGELITDKTVGNKED